MATDSAGDPQAIEAHLRHRVHRLPHALPARVFEERPIGTIAPSHGCIPRGRGTMVVQHDHVRTFVGRMHERDASPADARHRGCGGTRRV